MGPSIRLSAAVIEPDGNRPVPDGLQWMPSRTSPKLVRSGTAPPGIGDPAVGQADGALPAPSLDVAEIEPGPIDPVVPKPAREDPGLAWKDWRSGRRGYQA
ncbi:hypothetical protein A5727_09700 [Mycobacterium sp. ACS4331]|nr:hypothetical protein A5727_09700 [Mycobacterium sp. ACS4331]